MGRWRWLPVAAACPLLGQMSTTVLAEQMQSGGSSSSSSRPPWQLDLDLFEDSDCLEDPNTLVLLELMSELCDVMERTLGTEANSPAWQKVRKWRIEKGGALLQIAASVLDRPYCEPGKVALAAASCLLLLDDPDKLVRPEASKECVKDVEDWLKNTVPEGKIYDTRLHMFLRSPWPTFRLLDTLIQLWPEKNSESAAVDMGRCNANEDWVGNPLDFDWPWFRKSLDAALSAATKNLKLLRLDPADGPLSEQYRARHARVYRLDSFREAAAFSADCFYRFRNQQWTAGCHPGVVVSYIMQVVTFSIRDTEAWLQRYVGAAWRLLNLLTPFTSLLNANWPIFRALYIGSLLRRHPTPWTPRGAPQPWAGKDSTQALQERVIQTLGTDPGRVVYVSAAWGVLATSSVLGHVLSRWRALNLPRVLLLTVDAEARRTCEEHEVPGRLDCVDLPQRFGVEVFVAKYLVLAFIVLRAAMAVWLDVDVYLTEDPTARFEKALAAEGHPPFALPTFVNSQSLSPSIVVAHGKDETAYQLMQYAAWLYEHPYILDHQAWDSFVNNREGDFSGGWDYKGRNISSDLGDGLELSFKPLVTRPDGSSGTSKQPPRYVRLGPEFASADGWTGSRDTLASFHFWGATESQLELFETFYPFEGRGFSPAARSVLSRYRRDPVARDPASVQARTSPRTHITAVTYASGCCQQSIQRNKRSALEHGVDAAHAYGFDALDPEWAAQNELVLSQKKGGGWWLWKPYVILKTLRDEAVPWHTGVVLWLDAGNFYIGDPRPVVDRALRETDVAAMRLKCCSESDWTSEEALQRLGGKSYAIADRPQLGAYFLVFRKTATTMAFVEDWLRLSEEPEIIMEYKREASMDAAAGYQRHMADQSVFSVLFKQRGFKAMPLWLGHQVVQLDRWRE
eukprot:TRINITY_DN111791_c0_g1_i1.p1 TRINITY_DN111791_c0_g1~~TRINITY_DN111791_c0_g1_i1.p1  ORF type:complete len:909 (-),score=124.85 TRINITY_DN111791_c0_g1_i1:3-2729(-)